MDMNTITTPATEFKHPCFYVPGTDTIIDTAELHADEVWRSTVEKEDINQIRLRYPDAELGDFETIYKQVEASFRTIPVEITEEEFQYALGVLPPVGWRTVRGVEAFKISERLYGNITSIYARIDTRYFTFNDFMTVTSEQIADIVGQSHAFKRPPLKHMTLEEFRELNSSFYSPDTAEQHSARDYDILTSRIRKLNEQEGPRIGDFVIMPDDTVLRFTYEWPDEPRAIQTTTRTTNDNPSFYMNRRGVCDYSGSLDSALPIETLEETTETRFGKIWFFANDYAKAHNAVHALVSFRVYRHTPKP